MIKSKTIEPDVQITKLFIKFISDLYFDRDDGYSIKAKPFDFTKPFETQNIDINTLFQNTEYQVNLFSFIENQREPNYKIRSDLTLIKKLFEVAKIFHLIGHSVIIVGSDFKTNEYNQGLWINTPYKFDEIYQTIIKDYPILPFNVVNIYLVVNFVCG